MDPQSPPESVVWQHIETGTRYTGSGQLMVGAYRVSLICGAQTKGHDLDLVSGTRPYTCNCRFGMCRKK